MGAEVRIAFMLIILTLYLVLTGTVATAIGAFILAVFVALLNSLAPNGRLTVVARVIEIKRVG
jgi:hypothetical protein